MPLSRRMLVEREALSRCASVPLACCACRPQAHWEAPSEEYLKTFQLVHGIRDATHKCTRERSEGAAAHDIR